LDLRKPLAENIAIVGGTSLIPNFKAQLLEQLKSILSKAEEALEGTKEKKREFSKQVRFASLANLKPSLQILETKFSPIQTSWIGGFFYLSISNQRSLMLIPVSLFSYLPQ